MKVWNESQKRSCVITMIIAAVVLFLVTGISAGFSSNKCVLVEAESFSDLGGWSNDQQFMDQMGSPFLLAHGLGEPVEDAKTTVELPSKGKYRIWVRTRDWVAQWKVPGTPGKFRVLINGKAAKATFGTEGAKWHWQDGGIVEIRHKKIELSLDDLTGFEGRCDAILLSADTNLIPPDDAPGKWRRKLLHISEKPELAGEYDLVVIGAGVAGMTTAISASELGLSVALINNRPVLGGNSSSECRVGFAGRVCFKPYPNVGLLTKEISWSYGGAKRKFRFPTPQEAHVYQLKRLKEAKVDLFLNYHVNVVKTDSGQITEVGAQNIVNSKLLSFKGRWFADCTGDGCVGFLAGADFDMSPVHMGRTNLWKPKNTGKPSPFPRCPWAIDLTEKPFPGRGGKWECPNHRFRSFWGWFWESGFERDPIEEGEHIRDNNFRAMYGAWDCVKNVDKNYENHKLNSAVYISGKRESRRLLGDVILTAQDIKSGKKYPDGCVPAAWDLDVHIANPWFTDKVGHKKGFTQDPFISDAPMGKNTKYSPRPYWIPYRCLYSRNISNLFMAGRDISVTHYALGATRVQPTTGMMGEIVGMAASLCKKHNIDPRRVYPNHIDELKSLMKKGVGKN